MHPNLTLWVLIITRQGGFVRWLLWTFVWAIPGCIDDVSVPNSQCHGVDCESPSESQPTAPPDGRTRTHSSSETPDRVPNTTRGPTSRSSRYTMSHQATHLGTSAHGVEFRLTTSDAMGQSISRNTDYIMNAVVRP